MTKLILAILILVFIVIFPTYSRAALGIMLTFFLPGYALTAAIFVREPVRRSLHFTLSLVFSVTLSQIGGIIFNYLRVPLSTEQWVLWLFGITFIFSLIAMARREGIPQMEVVLNVDWRSMALFVVAFVLMFGAFIIAREGETMFPKSRFTSLWGMYTDNGLEIGAENNEGVPRSYRLYALSNGRQLYFEEFVLQHGEAWTHTIARVSRNDVEISLYLTSDPRRAYRSVRVNGIER